MVRAAVVAILTPSVAMAEADSLPMSLVGSDVGASGGVGEEIVTPVHELLMTRLQESGTYEVFGAPDLLELLEARQRKQLLDCDDDDDCLAQIGGALGAGLIAKASVGKVGATYLFHLKLLNSETAQVEARCSRELNGPVDAVLPAVSDCVGSVTRELSRRIEARRRDQGGGGGFLPFLVTGGVSVAAGVATLGLEIATGRKVGALRGDPGDTDAHESAKRLQTAGRIALGITVSAAVAAGVLALVTDFDSEPATETDVELAPVVDGDVAAFVLVGRFR
jgi:hypothetical protein